ncbi:hybrid sensor histidine kinase/response regulator [Caenimonas terrae]|uniref:histidine kinase n=1 Tax=Caenimonas terrae TaxID=696074 RepID=A0ABW0N7Y2_9BURK
MPATSAHPVNAAAAVPPQDVDWRKETHFLHFAITQSVNNTYTVWLIALFITFPTWTHAPFWIPAGWMLAVGLAYTLRARSLAPARQLAVAQAAPAAWRRRLNQWTIAAAAVAAAGPWLLYPWLEDIARMYVCMLYCCWLAGAMTSLGARPRLFAAYAVVFTIGLWLGWMRTDSPFLREILLLLAIYAIVLSTFARSFAKQVKESVEIRFMNERLVEQLTLAREAAEKSSQAKSRFLAVASHDLRQPLHAVTLLNGMLGRRQPPERVEEISRQMGRSLVTLERLFNSVLDFSKIEADRVKPEFAWHALAPLLEQLGHDYAPHAEQKGLALEMDAPLLALDTDAQLLERILRNLLENAIKFTEHGRVTLRAEQRPDALVLSVSDTGPGIPANLREEIFKEYYQSAGEKDSAGLGLGLAIVRRLADLLEIKVSVHDAQPQGARFELALAPQRVRAVAPGEAVPGDPEQEQVDLQGYFVVYVEDDASARDALQLLLADWGCKSVIADSLPAALRKLQGQGTPDVVLSDFSLRDGQTGIDVIEEMRRIYGPVAGAILTAESPEIQQRLARELEYPVLGKPLTAQELRSLLEVFKGIG